ncbi:MAG: C4-type zinc ribbon domain-containing protein [bacterium]|nr:C4-type zinc ribbon domain-containing protein [bacterium]
MRKQLAYLVQLQDIDNQLLDLKQERGNLPETVEKLRAEIEESTQLLDVKRDEQLNAGKERRRIENEVELAKVSLKKYQDQLFKVTTNREYDAITTEIEAAKVVINGGESRIIELLSKEEELSDMIIKLEAHLEQIKSDFEIHDAELLDKINQTSELEAKLLEDRSALIEQLARPIFGHYERIHLAKEDGMGVAQVYLGACGGCFAAIPPQKLMEISAMEDFILCETCGRIMVDPENFK